MLVPLSSSLHTAYMADGRTRNRDGSVPALGLVVRATSSAWKASAATAAALVSLDADLAEQKAAPVRLVDVYRSPEASAVAYTAYRRWIQAGRPKTARDGYDPQTMKQAFVRAPGTSLHNAGMAVDVDHEALEQPGRARGTDHALAGFWVTAARHGFTPIIATPDLEQSEAWHFDHLGPLASILIVASAAGSPQGNLAASIAATTLQGYHWPDNRGMERYLQALLLAAGHWCGVPDGVLGPMTLAALKMAGAPAALTKGRIEATQGIDFLRTVIDVQRLVQAL